MRTAITALTFCLALTILFTSQAESIQLNLSQKNISEAIEYGHAGRDLSHPELLRNWRIDHGYGVGSATLVTPFASIVVLAKEKAKRFLEPTESEIKKTLKDNKNQLVFGCALYGDTAWFADKYRAYLIYKDKKYEPSEKEVPTDASYTRSYPDPPRYWALCFYKFKIADLNPNARVTLVLKERDGQELKFPFNMAKLR